MRIKTILTKDEDIYYIFGQEDGLPMDITNKSIEYLEPYLKEVNKQDIPKVKTMMNEIKNLLKNFDKVRVTKEI